MRPAPRVASIPGSAVLELHAQAKALAAEGHDVVNMSVGEPDFDAPEVVRETAKSTVDSGEVRYTPFAGTPPLRAALAQHLSETRGVPFTPEQITVCHSAKHALSGTLLTLLEPGQGVLLPRPSWVSYEQQIRFAGGEPRWVEGRADHGPDFEALEAACDGATAGVMVNSPSNPSGYVWGPAEMERLCDLARRQDLWILSDEIYRRLVYEGEPNPSPTQFGDDARGRTIVVDGASKTFAMTGYRIGFAAGPEAVVSGIARLHSHLTGSPNTISQAAYAAALVEEPPEVRTMVEAFDQRRRFLVNALGELGLDPPWPRGAFYALCDVGPYTGGQGSLDFCKRLLEAEKLAVVPGEAFGLPHHIRLSYALSIDRIREAVVRLARFLESAPRLEVSP